MFNIMPTKLQIKTELNELYQTKDNNRQLLKKIARQNTKIADRITLLKSKLI